MEYGACVITFSATELFDEAQPYLPVIIMLYSGSAVKFKVKIIAGRRSQRNFLPPSAGLVVRMGT